jgi:hypothetical protein
MVDLGVAGSVQDAGLPQNLTHLGKAGTSPQQVTSGRMPQSMRRSLDPQRPAARARIADTALPVSGPSGARTVVNTRVQQLWGLPRRSQPATAPPTSAGSGSRSWRRPFILCRV